MYPNKFLLCPIMKRLEIIMRLFVGLIWGIKLAFKENDGKKTFLVKQKHQCHVSQWEEYVYGTQSWKEWRLLQESLFISFEGRMVERKAFIRKQKHQYCAS